MAKRVCTHYVVHGSMHVSFIQTKDQPVLFSGAHLARFRNLLTDNKATLQEVEKEMKESLEDRPIAEILEHAKGVSRRFFFCCEYKPKFVTAVDLRMALVMDVPTYVVFMIGLPKEKREEMHILITAAELVNTHAAMVLSKQLDKQHKNSVWLAFRAFDFAFEMKWIAPSCAICGKKDAAVEHCKLCKGALCSSCRLAHKKDACAMITGANKAIQMVHFPTLLDPSNLQICVKCHSFLKPVCYCPCKMATYCSKECQAAHRGEHKSECTYVPKKKKKTVATSE